MNMPAYEGQVDDHPLQIAYPILYVPAIPVVVSLVSVAAASPLLGSLPGEVNGEVNDDPIEIDRQPHIHVNDDRAVNVHDMDDVKNHVHGNDEPRMQSMNNNVVDVAAAAIDNQYESKSAINNSSGNESQLTEVLSSIPFIAATIRTATDIVEHQADQELATAAIIALHDNESKNEAEAKEDALDAFPISSGTISETKLLPVPEPLSLPLPPSTLVDINHHDNGGSVVDPSLLQLILPLSTEPVTVTDSLDHHTHLHHENENKGVQQPHDSDNLNEIDHPSHNHQVATLLSNDIPHIPSPSTTVIASSTLPSSSSFSRSKVSVIV
jgi:hypothetical protein